MSIEIRELRPDEHDQVLELWSSDAGDNRPDAADLLDRQAGLSVVARHEGKIVGAVLCAPENDGYRHHVTVSKTHRDAPLARQMLDKALMKLFAAGERRCSIRLPDDEQHAAFWETVAWDPDRGAAAPDAADDDADTDTPDEAAPPADANG